MSIVQSVSPESWFGTSLSIACPILAGLIILSPMPTAWTIYSTRSTMEYSFFPFLCMNIASVAWLLYGVLLNDLPIIIANIIGLLFSVIYSMVFIYFSKNRNSLRRMFCLYPLALAVFTAPFIINLSKDDRIAVVGVIVIVIHVIFMASPLAVVRTVLREKSVDSMPLSLSLAFFVNAVAWGLYGLLVLGELPLIISNGLSAIVTFFQLLLHIVYGRLFHCCCCFNSSSSTVAKESDVTESDVNLEQVYLTEEHRSTLV